MVGKKEIDRPNGQVLRKDILMNNDFVCQLLNTYVGNSSYTFGPEAPFHAIIEDFAVTSYAGTGTVFAKNEIKAPLYDVPGLDGIFAKTMYFRGCSNPSEHETHLEAIIKYDSIDHTGFDANFHVLQRENMRSASDGDTSQGGQDGRAIGGGSSSVSSIFDVMRMPTFLKWFEACPTSSTSQLCDG